MNESDEKTKRKFKHLMPIVYGFLGGLIAILIVLFLIVKQIIPLDIMNTEENKQQTPVTTEETRVNLSNETTDLTRLTKSVVGVINLQQRNARGKDEMAGTGSGIIYKKSADKAYIITNNHVIQNANEVEIELYNEERLEAKVIGADPLTDLAVLEIEGETIDEVATLGSSDDLTVGEDVVAIGNPLSLNFAGSVTRGIVSGLNRSVPIDTTGNQMADWVNEVIQTDAAINPGNSGGALVNKDGEVIGINSMKISQSEVEGIGFAIPIDTALPIIEALEKNGKVERPFIGISMIDLREVPPETQENIQIPEEIENGVIVTSIEPNSPAEEANIEPYDIITKINNESVESSLDLRKHLYTDTKPGETLDLELYRKGKKQQVTIKPTKSND